MNVLKELTSVHTNVTTLLETIHVVAGLAIGYLPMVTPALVSHFIQYQYKTLVSYVQFTHKESTCMHMTA